MLKWRRTIQETAPMRVNPNRRPWIKTAGALVAAIAAVKLLLHLYAGRHYGCFVFYSPLTPRSQIPDSAVYSLNPRTNP
jgi:hypothetical protein